MGFFGNSELWPSMLNPLRSHVRRLAETRGAEIAEAAAVLPLMFMMLLGIFWFGQAFSIYGAITRAAQEGARAGSVSSFCATCGTDALPQHLTNAVSAVQTALIASHLDPAQARVPVPAPVFNGCTGVTIASGNIRAQAPVHLTSGSSSTNCGISVSFQYPFQFWLPFTSLNNQKVWMSASALVRLESK